MTGRKRGVTRKRETKGEKKGEKNFVGNYKDKVDETYSDKSHMKYLNISISQFIKTKVATPRCS